MALTIRKAKRHAVPALLSFSGVSGSGKTFGALLVGAGMAGPKGRVGMIDCENGRGEMYADSPTIQRVLPNGYDYLRVDPPFSPDAYIEAIKAMEADGVNVCIIDSTSHEWEGIGGCQEIAERGGKVPDWKLAKRLHKRFVNYCLTSRMHLLFCLRAREKVRMEKVPTANGGTRTEVVPIGIQPIAEKNFVFEMLLSFLIEEGTHQANPLKVPESLAATFPAGKVLTYEDGVRIREWCDGGAVLNPHEQLLKRAQAITEDGVEAYKAFYLALPNAEKTWLRDNGHEQFKAMAENADRAIAAEEEGKEQA
jgi:hypothetical protein